MSFKIAYGAGHYLNTPGKRLPKELDKNQTREWTLNDRVARYFAEAAKQYDVELLRLDDPTGKKETTLAQRVKKANDWKANFYLSIHHNAGAKLTNAGGIVAFSYPKCANAAKYRDAIYDACIANGGLKGNRATPKNTASYYVIKYSKMDAVLVEYGFMDSKADYATILTEAYAKKMGYATMEGIAKVAGLKKIAKPAEPKKETTNKTTTTGVCNVEVKVLKKGAKGNAVKALQTLLIGAGYSCGSKGADGSFGANTEAAVKAYQKAKKIAVDGSVGPKTWSKLLGVN